MKRFILGFTIGMVIMVIAGMFWGLLPTFLGGRWDIATSNPIISNPFILRCDKLTNKPQGLGNVEVIIKNNETLVANLIVNLSIERPPPATYPNAKPGEFMIPQKACFTGTNTNGVAMFKNVPTGTAYIFFNNDPEAYPKRFGASNYSITPIEVKLKETTPITIELSQRK